MAGLDNDKNRAGAQLPQTSQKTARRPALGDSWQGCHALTLVIKLVLLLSACRFQGQDIMFCRLTSARRRLLADISFAHCFTCFAKAPAFQGAVRVRVRVLAIQRQSEGKRGWGCAEGFMKYNKKLDFSGGTWSLERVYSYVFSSLPSTHHKEIFFISW